jgi:predicted GNAT superfamily acetyltransferase
MITQKVGGIVAGAFEPDGRLAGFVLGFTGICAGRPAHWSHMLAVRTDRRDHGIGRLLKRYQRERLLELGVDTMFWSFDPLVARNAHLNLNELGAVVEEYVVDLYGPGEDSSVDRGIGTDRFIVRWDLRLQATRDDGGRRGPMMGDEGRRKPAVAAEGGTEPGVVRVEIPPDIQEIKSRSTEQAQEWRRATRAAFAYYLNNGFRVTGFVRDPTGKGGWYVLEPIHAP